MQAFALAKQFSKGKPSPKSLLYQSIFNPGKGLSKQKARMAVPRILTTKEERSSLLPIPVKQLECLYYRCSVKSKFYELRDFCFEISSLLEMVRTYYSVKTVSIK